VTLMTLTTEVCFGDGSMQEEGIPITGASATTLNGVGTFSHIVFGAAQAQVRLRFSIHVSDVNAETGTVVAGSAKREMHCETASFDVSGASGTGDHLMCDMEAPPSGLLAEAPNRRFRVVYGREVLVAWYAPSPACGCL